MVIVRLIGGLGNQMFQYALGKHLSKINKSPLKLDATVYDEFYMLRKYSLSVFNADVSFASPKEVYKLTQQSKNKFKKILNRIFNVKYVPPKTYIKEKHFHFDAKILKLPDSVYLQGYWQSEKYFKDINQEIRSCFSFVKPQAGKDKEIASTIAAHNSISVHVRRGDYVTNPVIRKMLHTIDIEYYRRAFQFIEQRIRKPLFVIFSDDIQWVRMNLRFNDDILIVDHNDESKCAEDLRLMTQCKHHVMANSSFSWWGAWLGSNPGKIVVAPKKWFVDDSYDTRDLLPIEWIVL